MAIPFTQYMRPMGDRKPVTIDRPEEIEKLALWVIDHGAHFDIEVLRTGQISMTCERGEDVLAHEVVENGPPVVEAVDRLVKAAHELLQRLPHPEAD